MITKGLKLNVQGAYTSKEWFDETRKVVPELWYYDHRDANGNLAGTRQSVAETVQYSKSQDLYRKYYLQATMTWNRQFADVHNFTALVHYEMSDEKTASKSVEKVDGKDVENSMLAIPVRYQGLSAKLGYNYNDIYMIDGNFGYTGSENFQSGNQFGFFLLFLSDGFPVTISG